MRRDLLIHITLVTKASQLITNYPDPAKPSNIIINCYCLQYDRFSWLTVKVMFTKTTKKYFQRCTPIYALRVFVQSTMCTQLCISKNPPRSQSTRTICTDWALNNSLPLERTFISIIQYIENGRLSWRCFACWKNNSNLSRVQV